MENCFSLELGVGQSSDPSVQWQQGLHHTVCGPPSSRPSSTGYTVVTSTVSGAVVPKSDLGSPLHFMTLASYSAFTSSPFTDLVTKTTDVFSRFWELEVHYLARPALFWGSWG